MAREGSVAAATPTRIARFVRVRGGVQDRFLPGGVWCDGWTHWTLDGWIPGRRRPRMLRGCHARGCWQHAKPCPPWLPATIRVRNSVLVEDACRGNPYLEEFQALPDGSMDARGRMQRCFAWAIPGPEAVAEIARHGPVCEIGAGTGYWARMLRDQGVDVAAYDREPYLNWHCDGHWSEVLQGDGTMAARHPDRTLLLVWPDDGADHAALQAYAGRTVITVSEECCQDDRARERLVAGWDLAGEVQVPQWPQLHDALEVFTRRN
jgi:hypothetical protein